MSTLRFNIKPSFLLLGMIGLSLGLGGCADVNVPDSRNVNIPAPVTAEERREAVNERPDSVMYLPLGEDILVPAELAGSALPQDIVGPFELRGETLAGALQLILADYDIALAFETDEGLTRQITVANLKGPLNQVVSRVCSLADLYCSYEESSIVIKDTQVFTVTLPPIGNDGETAFIDDVITGLTAIVGEDVTAPVSDPTTRTIIYTATQRSSKLAEKYFQRLRANTALVVFETYIWEVSLNSGNSTGINWDEFTTFGKFNTGISVSGSVGANFTNPVSIGLPTTNFIGRDTDPIEFVRFLSQFGAVKTISQPQISVLSGSQADLRVADTQNFVSEIVTTLSDGGSTTSVTTDSVDTGFTLTIGSSWDKSTVYADVNIALENVNDIEDFTFSDGGAAGTSTTIQLPQTSERELNTQIRVRPGDSILIAGLVRESDNFDSRGPGFMEPILPDSRTAETRNLELVFMMRPRVIVYTSGEDQRYQNYAQSKQKPAPLTQSPLVGKVREDVLRPAVPVDPRPVAPAPLEPKPIASAPIIPPVLPPVYEPPVYEPPVAAPAMGAPPAPIAAPALAPAPIVSSTVAPQPIVPRARTVEEILGEDTYSILPPSLPQRNVAPEITPSENLETSAEIGGIMIEEVDAAPMYTNTPNIIVQEPAVPVMPEPESPVIDMRVNDFSASAGGYVPYSSTSGGRVSRQTTDLDSATVSGAPSSSIGYGGYTSYAPYEGGQ